jgi:hypothetical protein
MKRTHHDMTEAVPIPRGTMLGLQWHKTQADADAAARAAHGGRWFSVKHHPYYFSHCTDADDFINKMYQYRGRDDLELYEQRE